MGEASTFDEYGGILERVKEEYMRKMRVKKNKINASRNRLSEKAIRGEWDAVQKSEWEEMLKKYKASNNETLHELVVSEESGDTAFHMAVLNAPVKIVENIVEMIENLDVESRIKILKWENRRKNTPLHLAASRGIAKVCKRIASIDQTLIDIRNEDDETPLFMAALHGQNKAFFALHLACRNNNDRHKKNSKRSKDGDNILHCAVAGDYFDLAFYITGEYNYLVCDCNDRGLSPLHLLASKPAAFKSGSNLGWLDRIIYNCIQLGQNTVEKIADWEHHGERLTFFGLIRKVVREITITGENSSPDNVERDVEIGANHESQAITITGEKSSPDNDERDEEIGTIRESQGEKSSPGNDVRDVESGANHESRGHNKSAHGAQEYGLFLTKYKKFFKYVTLVVGYRRIRKNKEKTEKHTWALLLVDRMVEVYGKSGISILETVKSKTMKLGEEMFDGEQKLHQILDEAVSKLTHKLERAPFVKWMECSSSWADEIEKEINGHTEKSKLVKWMAKVTEIVGRIIGTGETPLLVASKNGVTEMIEKILKNSPAAIREVDFHGKNVVHFAVENRRFHVYNLLQRKDIFSVSAFRHVDEEGNSTLHLAATLPKSRPSSRIPGPALQMQWEIDWFKFIKKSFHSSFFTRYNHHGQTAEDLFTETHKKLVRQGSVWLNKTSGSCSLVAAIIAPVAFSTSATISDNVTDSKDKLNSKEQLLALDIFSISSFVALCSSIISLIIFLAITNARHQAEDFKTRLPRKFLVALSALLLSIIATLISFCSTHFLTVKDTVKFNVFPVYAFLWVAVPLIVLFQFPLYPDFLTSMFELPRPIHS